MVSIEDTFIDNFKKLVMVIDKPTLGTLTDFILTHKGFPFEEKTIIKWFT